MRVHITTINNIGGPARIAQDGVVQIMSGMGWHDIGLFYYPAHTDSEEQLNSRMAGVISSISIDDIVIFQYPSWNGNRYDNRLIDYLKVYSKKLILFVHDVQALLFAGKEINQEVLLNEINMFNRSDLLILASEKLHEVLLNYGLRKDLPVVYQKIWDFPTELVITKHEPIKRILFTGAEDNISYYQGKTQIYHFSYKNNSSENPNIKWYGFLDTNNLLLEMAKGGFGLGWSDDVHYQNYDCMNQSHKLAGYLAAGLPVLVRKDCVHEEFVRKNKIGFIISSLEEADQIVAGLSDKEYLELYENVKKIQTLITKGFYTRRTLNTALIKMLDLSE